MLTYPTQTLFVEGPDCSGKTTLISKIHSVSDYRWHVMDRSQLSRDVFGRLYNRSLSFIDSDLHSEMYNLNNRYVILDLPWSVVERRFLSRGDPLHNHASMKKVHDAFTIRFGSVKMFPNIIHVSRETDVDELAATVVALLDVRERALLKEVANEVIQAANTSPTKEVFPLSFTLYDTGEFEEADPNILDYEPETEYYETVYRSLLEKIDDELAGNNVYNRKEDLSSRRFVFTGDSCISFIHVSQRNSVMDFHCVIRSCNVATLFEHDLRFLYFLASVCWKKIGRDCDQARLRFNLNSAHII